MIIKVNRFFKNTLFHRQLNNMYKYYILLVFCEQTINFNGYMHGF